MRPVLAVIYNPASRGFHRDQIEKIREYFELHNKDLEFFETHRKGDGSEIAHTLVSAQKPPEIIAGLGGDGTLNEIAQSLVHSPIPLGIIPAGTANVLARDLRIPFPLLEACEVLISGKIQTMPLGQVNLQGDSISRFFLLMCGIGWDGFVCKSINPKLKENFGKGAYAFETIRSVFTKKLEHFDIHTPEDTYLASTLIISITAHYGGNLALTPEATPFDEEFHLFLLKSKTRTSLLEFLGRLSLGKTQTMKDVQLVRSREISIHRPGISLQIDGDYLGETPATITRIPDALRVIVPG